eukprot:CAMPEP_0185766246 /NCGR_PEP_ID=MMETSP1174-20130828/35794_1 /TAXON_ID=35687 /ORGANISM="Dictyocha speculum, Strain CCMP1381" /LENGTH=65 /DNA_ID=CAMNT_0028449817 /DNA_START=69 /DNA_END=266 /DNA_ORIENTATION=-
MIGAQRAVAPFATTTGGGTGNGLFSRLFSFFTGFGCGVGGGYYYVHTELQNSTDEIVKAIKSAKK